MPSIPFLGRAQKIREQSDILASYMNTDIEELSPWADSSNLERITREDLLGLSPSRYSRDRAMRIAAVAKARNLMCTTIGQLPLLAYENGEPLKEQPAWLGQLQCGVPNFHTISWIVDHLLFHGRAWLLIAKRDSGGAVSDSRFVPYREAETKDGALIRAFGKDVSPREVIRIDANNEGLLAYGRDVLIEAVEIDQAAREAGANPVPSVVIRERDNAAAQNKEQIKELLSGYRSERRKVGGSVVYANKAVDIQSLGQKAENLLIDARNHAVLQIARAVGLPAWALDGAVEGANLNYQNQASRNREIVDAVAPMLRAIETCLSLFLPKGITAGFDATEMLRADTKDRYETYKTALEAGFLTIEEVRAREGLTQMIQEQTP